jgi:pimeloyl-ACP methyl ester carboxylesterase
MLRRWNGSLRSKERDYAVDNTRIHVIRAPDTDDIFLGVLEKRAAQIDESLPPVLLIHGATFGAKLFDLSLPGYSLMSELARFGRAVYALDIRGYGNSLNGTLMEAPPEAHPPFARIDDAVKDIGATVKFVLERERVSALDLIGFSWGTVTAAAFASGNPDLISRLALYAPLYGDINPDWLRRIADPNDRNRVDPGIGSYRLITLSDLTQRWNDDLPVNDPDLFREKRLPEVIFKSLAALDPLSRTRVPPAFRSPTGALADLVSVFNGRPLYDPSKLTMPTLLVRGANDTTATDSDARQLLSAIESPEKQYCIITPGSHFLCVEKNRSRLYERLNRFLKRRGINQSLQNRIQQ